MIGEEGAKQYGSVHPGHDGAYATLTSQQDGTVIVGTDDAGYGKVYLYTQGNRWAIGTSLIELAHYVKSNNWGLSRNHTQLLSLKMRPGMIAQQLTSSDTVFSEIELVPPSHEIVITSDSGISMRKRASKRAESYEAQLSIALSELVGRTKTLLSSGTPLVSDLSGGRDSRVILAAIRYALGGTPAPHNIRFRSNRRQKADFTTAQNLATQSGIRLNGPVRANALRRDPIDAFNTWRRNDLGVYHPVYPDIHYGGEIALSGAAGGAHRTVYRGETLEESMSALASPSVNPDVMRKIVEQAEKSVRTEGASVDSQLTHFRLFRNRIHGGRNSLRGVSIAPLAARALAVASNELESPAMKRAQFYADIMFNLAPDLARQPYDEPHKNWNHTHYQNLTIVPLDSTSDGGQVYGTDDIYSPDSITMEADYIAPFVDAFETSQEDAQNSGLASPDEVKRGRIALADATPTAFKHAVDAIPVSHVILAREVLRLTGA